MFAMINDERLGALQNFGQPFDVKINPFFVLSDTEFVKTYILSKNWTNYLIELVTSFIEPLVFYRMLKVSTSTHYLNLSTSKSHKIK
jgi:hypothetical protein